MKKLDPENLFSIFSLSDEEIAQEERFDFDFRNHPYIIIGMVKKGVENFDLMSEVYTRREGEEFTLVEEEVKLKYYTTLYGYLRRFNYQSIEHIEQALRHDVYEIGYALIEMRVLFEKYEDYEKCARIRDVFESIDMGAELLNRK